MSRTRRAVGVIFVAAVLASTVGCTAPAQPSGPSNAPSGSSTSGPSNQASPAPASWSSQPVTITHNVSVPPVPRLVGVRSAAHPEEGYDRIVFDFNAAIPGYTVAYVTQPVADGSGNPVSVPGRRFLQVRFSPAQAHDDAGASSVARAATVSLPMLVAYSVTGDFEGAVTVVLGLDDMVGFRLGELPGTPARVYIDVAA